MQPWILYGLLSAVTAALVTIFAKLGLNGINPTFATMIRSGIMFVAMIAATVFSGRWSGFSTLNPKTWWTIVLSGLAGAASWLFYFLALKYGPATRVAALDRLSFFFIVLLSVLFLGEALTWKTAVGTAMIVSGVLLFIL